VRGMDKVEEYIRAFISAGEPDAAGTVEPEGLLDGVQPDVGVEVGRFLSLMVRVTGARRALELGTSLGYSAIWLGRALKATGGTLISVERDEGLCELARRNVLGAGLSDVVKLVRDDVRPVLDRLDPGFDIILQDSDKTLYPELLGRCVELVRLHGLIVADDALFKPRGVREKFSGPVHRYNEAIFADPRLFSTILPIGDGIAVSVKIDEVGR
jgi:predicted O-methyltransferase YrrM